MYKVIYMDSSDYLDFADFEDEESAISWIQTMFSQSDYSGFKLLKEIPLKFTVEKA